MTTISTCKFTRTVEFRVSENGILKGVTICGPSYEQRVYYAVQPMLGECVLSLDILEEALKILKFFNKDGYDLIVNKIIPATINEITIR